MAQAKPLLPLSEGEVARFWAKVERRGCDECWPWMAGKNANGYGYLGRDGRPVRMLRANRVAWALANNREPGSLHLLHSCDNRWCVNPAHLRLGTNNDNIADMMSRGRHWLQRKTRCKHGHEFTAHPRIPTRRICTTCNREAGRRFRERQREIA